MFINCRGRLLDLNTPRIMGILNLTPDSFYSGSRLQSIDSALSLAESMLNDGATCLDLGGYSSRPGAADISEEVEKQRIIPVISAIVSRFPEAYLSVDTFRSGVAKEAVAAGAVMVNDISAGLLDPSMLPVVAELKVPYILMHMRGNPLTMSTLTTYQNLIQEIVFYFSQRIREARNSGILDIIADPGFGFAKTQEQNFELLSKLDALKVLEVPILVGISRKSMIWKTLGIDASAALNGTTALHMVALQSGAQLLRVHDVKEAVECVKLWKALQADSSTQSS
ncbi:MAG: dihydropteroate synthase [Bacteroidota bacterium]|jgi:dihydropteroate synthase